MKPHFEIGQLVYHVRFNYRGVIYGVDDCFKGTEEWYEHMCKNTKPPKDKPWYNVLVHNATHTTYVTERNLVLDDSGEDVVHHMVPLLFTTLKNGIYSLSSNWVDGKPIPPDQIGMA